MHNHFHFKSLHCNAHYCLCHLLVSLKIHDFNYVYTCMCFVPAEKGFKLPKLGGGRGKSRGSGRTRGTRTMPVFGGGDSPRGTPVPAARTLPNPVEIVEFFLYADSRERVDSVKGLLRQLIDDECKTEAVEDPAILELSQDQVEEIEALGNHTHVGIQVDRTDFLPRIKVTGPVHERKTVLAEIRRIIADFKNKQLEVDKYARECQW